MTALEALAGEVRSCRLCTDLPLGPRPILRVSETARVLIASQAPGTKVHVSGTPWTDASGHRLRGWLGMAEDAFYDGARVAILPMGLCYPGRLAHGGDLPPRAGCAPVWRGRLLGLMPGVRLTLLVGAYAQADALGPGRVTDRVRGFRAYLPRYFPLPHPSWRTGVWERRNGWFGSEVLPALREAVRVALAGVALLAVLAGPVGATDLSVLLPPPPADGDAVTMRDVERLRALQASRTPADEAAARADVEESVFLFQDVLGPAFDARRLPRTADLFARLAEEANGALNRAKDGWGRTRPSRVAGDLRPCLAVPGTASYPSGHAVLGSFYAAVLGRMLPERRAELWARAAVYAGHREVCGLHYPSDTAAGYAAGAALAAVVLAEPARVLAVAEGELRPALGLPAAVPEEAVPVEGVGSEDFRVR